ncbi:PRC-barrel domain-containing protein [Desulfitobacterium metallireducens]|uniref:Photosystem reaction center subunit H n=1 Tax=Desulfitobacterium metallireducens DSM 15288 TaxID=871968 RepID=W0E7G0_9FIRM|nr:PRC-barrel domain-containing protein [Desulfitobacterium metallireducens]AHF06692.1 photosystem reaction center subunit H [Desulfitobacterium metallireducens DSM 15288]
MKASKEIKGLRIISIADGTQVGVIKDLILNPKTGSLDFFIIDQPADYFGAKVIPFNDIVGLGEFAVTIPDPQVIQDVSQNLEAQELLKQDVNVIGTKVLTKKGSLIGEVQEYLVDEEKGKISACIFVTPDGNTREVAAQDIITFGKELLIIDVVYTETLVGEAGVVTDGAQSITQSIETVPFLTEEILTETHQESSTEFNLFEQRQLQYFIGKTVDKNIVLDNGETLNTGEPMSDEIIRKITSRNKLMEITSYLHKN